MTPSGSSRSWRATSLTRRQTAAASSRGLPANPQVGVTTTCSPTRSGDSPQRPVRVRTRSTLAPTSDTGPGASTAPAYSTTPDSMAAPRWSSNGVPAPSSRTLVQPGQVQRQAAGAGRDEDVDGRARVAAVHHGRGARRSVGSLSAHCRQRPAPTRSTAAPPVPAPLAPARTRWRSAAHRPGRSPAPARPPAARGRRRAGVDVGRRDARPPLAPGRRARSFRAPASVTAACPERSSTVAASVIGPQTCTLTGPANPVSRSSRASRSCAKVDRARAASRPGRVTSRHPDTVSSPLSPSATARPRPLRSAQGPRAGSSGRWGKSGNRSITQAAAARGSSPGNRPDSRGAAHGRIRTGRVRSQLGPDQVGRTSGLRARTGDSRRRRTRPDGGPRRRATAPARRWDSAGRRSG